MSRPKPTDPNYADMMNNPLPGAMMPTGEEEKFIPEKQPEAEASAKARPQYSDEGDKDQTIPL